MSQHDNLNESDLRSVLAAIPAMVFVIGADRRIQFASRIEEQYTQDEVVGTDALDFIDPGFRDSLLELLEGVFETGEAAEYEIPIETPDGEREWHAGTLTPLQKDGRVSSVIVVDTDVTARRRAEEEADRFRTLVPVCSWCKKIRRDEGYWEEIEEYIEEASGSHVTHGMCPDCEGKIVNDGLDSA